MVKHIITDKCIEPEILNILLVVSSYILDGDTNQQLFHSPPEMLFYLFLILPKPLLRAFKVHKIKMLA